MVVMLVVVIIVPCMANDGSPDIIVYACRRRSCGHVHMRTRRSSMHMNFTCYASSMKFCG